MRYRQALPQLDGNLFLTDAGLETDLIFNHGVEIREFAAHTLLDSPAGRRELARYFSEYIALAAEYGTGFIMDAPVWKAHRHWAGDLGQSTASLHQSNRDAVSFVAQLRDEYSAYGQRIVLNAVVGPHGDAYSPEDMISADVAESYHHEQLSWLAATEVDMVTAMTFTQSTEATGFCRAAARLGLPSVVSFTVETDGYLPSGETLRDAIRRVDRDTNNAAQYFMINCAHPEHFQCVLSFGEWCQRIRGLRCNASRCSHAELDEAKTLDAGNPLELAASYADIVGALPWINVIGGCCGSDIRHIRAIARQLLPVSAARPVNAA